MADWAKRLWQALPSNRSELILVLLSVFAAVAGLCRVLILHPEKGLSIDTLYFFLAAGVLLILKDVDRFKFLDIEFVRQKVKEAEQKAERAEQKAEALEDAAGISIAADPASASGARMSIRVDDPQKRQWGGMRELNYRRVFVGQIRPSASPPGHMRIPLQVESTDPTNHPLAGTVTFHLHPSFRNQVRQVPVVNGTASLTLYAYGAFTVGIECSDGTKLEIDLADDDIEAPIEFKRA